MRHIGNRVKAGVMALALAFAQIVVPVAPVFAANNNGTLKVHEIGTPSNTESNDPKVCAFNFEGFGFDAQQEGYINLDTQGGGAPIGVNSGNYPAGPATNSGYFVSQDFNTPNGVAIPDGTYKATLYGKGGAANAQNEKAKSKVFKVECAPVVTRVTAVNGSFADTCGPTFNAMFTATVTTGVTYVPVVNGNTISVTATSNQGYTLTNPDWSQSYTDMLVACPTTDKPATAVNGMFVDVCGDIFNLKFIAATTEGVTYVETKNGNTINVTATAKPGYILSNPNWSQSQTDALTACPVIKPCVTTSTTMVSKYEDFADYNDTRATGHTEFTDEGLRVWTEGTTSTDKVAWYNLVTPYPFSEIGTPAIDYENTAGGTPGMQILFDKDGNGTQDAILVGEPGFYDGRWWSNAYGLGVPARDGYNSSATLQEYLTANPNAQVLGVGFSLGSGVKGDGVLKSLTFGCQTWVFKKAPRVPTVCTVSENLYSKEWQYDGDTFPEAAFGGSYNFEPTGLYLNTPTSDSYVYGLIDGGNTPIADVDAMSYRVMRLPQSAGFTSTLPSYILLVDTNGSAVADGLTYFLYEPYYNDQTRAAVEGSFQLWDAIDDGNAKWYVSGTGQALRSWDSLLDQYEDAVVLAYGVNQGQSNAETFTAVQDITFDCATTSFTNGGSGGSGGSTPVTPTAPVIPVVPSLPVGGQGAVVTPAELPMTGQNGSILFTWFALLAAILTYGSVYYLQPKKRFEQ